MKALLVGDVHLADRPPSVRTDTYADDILDKLRYCVEYANAEAEVLVLLGDVFHVKAPSRTSHRLVMRTAEVLEGFQDRVLIVPGNHDLSQDRLDSLQSQPLGALALSPNITLLQGHDFRTGIFGIPYLSNWADLPTWLGQAAETAPSLVVTHAPIFPPGQDPPYDYISAPDWDRQMSAAAVEAPVAYGHIHDPHGFYTVSDRWFCNNGAISRGSLHEQTVKREPHVTLFDTAPLTLAHPGCPFTSVPLPFKPAEEVFRLTEHREQQASEQRLDAFLASIGDVALTTLSLEEVLAQAATSGLTPTAKTELAEIVESAVHG